MPPAFELWLVSPSTGELTITPQERWLRMIITCKTARRIKTDWYAGSIIAGTKHNKGLLCIFPIVSWCFLKLQSIAIQNDLMKLQNKIARTVGSSNINISSIYSQVM